MAEDKALGLHQRIPMDILLEAFKAELNDDQDLERLSQLINTEYAGENRQKKRFRSGSDLSAASTSSFLSLHSLTTPLSVRVVFTWRNPFF